MASETLKELKYDGKKIIAEVARRDDVGNKIASTYLTDIQIISENEINEAFETVFGTTTTVKKLLDAKKSAAYLFSYYDGTSIDDLIKYNDTSNVTATNNMFSGCKNLTTVPLLDTTNVTNMGSMFYNCSSLTSIPAFDTSNVTNMSSMFSSCGSLTEIRMINIGADLDLSYCDKMDRKALLIVLGNLKNLTGSPSKTLTLRNTLLGKLTESDKLIATNKNWILA